MSDERPADPVKALRTVREALREDDRRQRRAQTIGLVGSMLMSVLALLIAWQGTEWEVDRRVGSIQAERVTAALVELDQANASLNRLGLPLLARPSGANADEIFRIARRGQSAADRAEERRALGQPIDPGPDPLVPPPALTAPDPVPRPTAAPPPGSTGASPTAQGPTAATTPPTETQSAPPPAPTPGPTSPPGTDTGAEPPPVTTDAPTTTPPSPTAQPSPPTTGSPDPEPSPPPRGPPPGGGLLPLLPGLRLPGIGPLLA